MVEAWPVSIFVECHTGVSALGEGSKNHTRIDFVAEAGHSYRIDGFDATSFTRRKTDGVDLIDVTDGEHLPLSRRFYSDEYVDVSTGEATALIVGEQSTNRIYCGVIDVDALAAERNPSGDYRTWEIDAGPVTITTRCFVDGLFGEKNLISSFDFVAEAGHAYLVRMQDQECTRLMDVSMDEYLVACEPAIQGE